MEGLIDDSGVEAYLKNVHDIDYSDIRPDEALAAVLSRLAVPTWVFTASVAEHAQRCIDHLELGEQLRLQGIIDTRYSPPAHPSAHGMHCCLVC